MSRPVSDAEKNALAILAEHGRVVAILIPEGIPDEDIKQLVREVDARLDELAAKRDSRPEE